MTHRCDKYGYYGHITTGCKTCSNKPFFGCLIPRRLDTEEEDEGQNVEVQLGVDAINLLDWS